MAIDLNKHIVPDENNFKFHSNGIAKVNNGDHIGASSCMTFSQRQEVEKNRRLIYGYQRSAIGNSYSTIRAKPVIKTKDPEVSQNRQQYNTRGRITPPIRKYNPYA